MLDPCAGTASLRQASADVSAGDCRWATGWRAYLRSPNDASHPYAVPGASLRLADLAPTLLLVGEGDAMRDEGLCFARRLADAGVAVTQRVLPTSACWPGALYAPGTAGDDAACQHAMRRQVSAFFAAGPPQAG